MCRKLPWINAELRPASTLGSPYYSYRKALPDEHKWQVGDTAAWQIGQPQRQIRRGHDSQLRHHEQHLRGRRRLHLQLHRELLRRSAEQRQCDGAWLATASRSQSPGSHHQLHRHFSLRNIFQGFGPPAWDTSIMDYGFFGEDHWKLTPAPDLRSGLRYDYEALPAAVLIAAYGFRHLHALPGIHERPVRWLHRSWHMPSAGRNANLTNHPSEKTAFGPRIGIAFDPWGDGKTTLRLGYGLYFGPITTGQLLNNLLNTGSPKGQYTTSTYYPNIRARRSSPTSSPPQRAELRVPSSMHPISRILKFTSSTFPCNRKWPEEQSCRSATWAPWAGSCPTRLTSTSNPMPTRPPRAAQWRSPKRDHCHR